MTDMTEPLTGFNPSLWVDGVLGHEDQYGRCKGDPHLHFRRPECTDWVGANRD